MTEQRAVTIWMVLLLALSVYCTLYPEPGHTYRTLTAVIWICWTSLAVLGLLYVLARLIIVLRKADRG